MSNTAAHLVDRVLPAVPVRQWVLSLPFELRAMAAFRADVLTRLSRILIEAISVYQRAWAKRAGLGSAQTGAITFIQRFGGSLNLHVHFHVVVTDGAFVRDDAGRAVFHAMPPPTRAELDVVVRRVQRRSFAWLARRGLVDDSPLEERRRAGCHGAARVVEGAPRAKENDVTEQEFERVLSAEGFTTVVLVTYEANGGRDLHEHPFESKALVLSGELEIDTDGTTTHYRAGDVFHLGCSQPHVERYGPAGVSYLVGRK